MAYSTVLELRDAALHDDFDPVKYGASAETWVLDALKDLSRKLHLPTGEFYTPLSAVAGDRLARPLIDINSVVSIIAITDTVTKQTLTQIPFAEPSLETGTPTSYMLFAQQIDFQPIPDFTDSDRYALYYHGLPSNPGTGSVAVDLDEAVVSFVRSRLFKREDDFEMAQFWMADYKSIVAEKRAELGNRGRLKRVIGQRQASMYPTAYRP